MCDLSLSLSLSLCECERLRDEGTINGSISLSLSEKQQNLGYLSLLYTNSPLSLPGTKSCPCFFRDHRIYIFHRIADIVSELSFYGLNECKNKKNNRKKKKKERKEKRKNQIITSIL